MNDRFKFRVWDTDIKEYLVGEFLVGGCGDMIHNVVDYESFLNKGNYIIEQCTGLKDKNGNLIYEGNIVEDMWGDALFIKWRDSEARFAAEDDNVAYDLEDIVDGCDIIGNIHTQAEQKD